MSTPISPPRTVVEDARTFYEENREHKIPTLNRNE